MIPADTHVTVNDRLLPTGTEAVDGTKYDLRNDTKLTEQPFDDAWTDVHHDVDGTVTAVFNRPDGLQIRVGGDDTITSFQMCTGTGFPTYKHPSGVAIEPQTAYANAFNTGNQLIVIEPGEETTTELFITAEQR
jgi:aldose 1-epimerase